MVRIPPELRSKLKSQLISEEGLEEHVYTDTTGKLIIGVGRDIQDVGISVDEALYLLDNDIQRVETELWQYCPWYADLDNVRKMVIIDMAFNLDIHGLLQFKNMIAALQVKDYVGAKNALLDSLWAKQVGKRATHLAMQMETASL